MNQELQQFLDDIISAHFPKLPMFVDKEKFYLYQRNVLISNIKGTHQDDESPPFDVYFLFPLLSCKIVVSNNFTSLLDREDDETTHFFVTEEIRKQIDIEILRQMDTPVNFDFKNN